MTTLRTRTLSPSAWRHSTLSAATTTEASTPRNNLPFVWFARIAPAKTWEITQQALADLRDQPTLEVRYGISPDAAKLLEWIEGLRDKDYLRKWTPTVEDELEKKIGIHVSMGQRQSSGLPNGIVE
jgi:hypothetical protein